MATDDTSKGADSGEVFGNRCIVCGHRVCVQKTVMEKKCGKTVARWTVEAQVLYPSTNNNETYCRERREKAFSKTPINLTMQLPRNNIEDIAAWP